MVDAGGFAKGYGTDADSQTEYLLKGMSMLNYDCINLAVKDFANGGEFLKRAAQDYKMDFISTNVVYSENKENFVEPFIIKKISARNSDTQPPFDKLTVGFFGLCDEKDPLLHRNSTEKAIKSYNPVEAAQDVIPKLKKKVDLVVLVFNGRFKTLEAILSSVDGIDVVIMGGEYYRAEQYTDKNIIIASTPSLGKYFGILSLELDKNKKIISSNKRRIPLDESFKDDPKLANLIAEFESKK